MQIGSLPAETERALVAELRESLRGEVVDREHPAYDSARKVWNGLIDRHPAVIARCTGLADVVAVVQAARRYRPVVSIRSGGHQVAGSAVCDDGLVIDLSRMRGVHVDPVARTVRVQAGATWGDVDRETQVFGLVAPGGEVSETGVAGLTLGGGMGLLQRAFGLSCDNLRSVQVVTADGVVRTASRKDHADLFWAARGAGRGLGVVTSFEFDLHPLGPEVAVAEVLYPYENAEAVTRAWREATLAAPDTISPELALWCIPPDPAMPQELHGARVVVVAAVYAGPPEEAADTLRPLQELGTPLADFSGTQRWVDVQSEFDGLVPDGGRYYMNSHFLDELDDAAIAQLLACDGARPNPEPFVVLRTMGGAIARVGSDETAYPHRSARYNLSVDGLWFDPALDDAVLGWARSTWAAMRPFGNGGVYLNFAGSAEEAERSRGAVLGRSAQRLDAVRREYDESGLFADAARRP